MPSNLKEENAHLREEIARLNDRVSDLAADADYWEEEYERAMDQIEEDRGDVNPFLICLKGALSRQHPALVIELFREWVESPTEGFLNSDLYYRLKTFFKEYPGGGWSNGDFSDG